MENPNIPVHSGPTRTNVSFHMWVPPYNNPPQRGPNFRVPPGCIVYLRAFIPPGSSQDQYINISRNRETLVNITANATSVLFTDVLTVKAGQQVAYPCENLNEIWAAADSTFNAASLIVTISG